MKGCQIKAFAFLVLRPHGYVGENETKGLDGMAGFCSLNILGLFTDTQTTSSQAMAILRAQEY